MGVAPRHPRLPGYCGRVKYRFWVNNGRPNHIWQTAYHDRFLAFRRDRFSMSPLEINPQDAKELGIESGDIVELHKCRSSGGGF
jgi:arsenite oxidase large subunit